MLSTLARFGSGVRQVGRVFPGRLVEMRNLTAGNVAQVSPRR